MVDVVLRYTDFDTMKTQLQAMGVTVREPAEGETLHIESYFGVVNTPFLTATNGDISFCLRLTNTEANLLPLYISPPEFVCDWRDDEVWVDDTDPENPIDVLFDYPMAEVNTYDLEGNVDGTMMQSVGRIL